MWNKSYTAKFAGRLVILTALAAAPALLPRAQAAVIGGQQSQAQGADPAYLKGYNAGYQDGQQDRQNGMRANPHKFRVYQVGSAGYTASYGPRAQYRASFQSGFDDGYADGYANRPESIGPQAAPAAPPSAAPSNFPAPAAPQAAPSNFPSPAPAAQADGVNPESQKIARGNGYREGYSAGEYDANRGAAYNALGNGEYESALTGYTPSLGTEDQYQQWFRGGFRTGYDDGFNHRLYNSAIGRRDSVAAPPAGNTQGGIPLPTNPEVLASRPSGVYSNGILLEQGTEIKASMNSTISTEYARPGDPFTATVSVPVWVGSKQAIPAGSIIHGTVEQATRAGKVSGNAQMQLRYDTIELPGGQFTRLHATTVGVGQSGGNQQVGQSEGTVNEKSGRKGDVEKVAGLGGLGAIIGAIAGGGKGAAIGGILGAGAGTAGVLMTRGRDVTLHQGEAITLRLDRPMELVPLAAGSAGAQSSPQTAQQQ